MSPKKILRNRLKKNRKSEKVVMDINLGDLGVRAAMMTYAVRLCLPVTYMSMTLRRCT